MVVLWRLLLVLLEMRRDWQPLSSGATAAYVSRSLDSDAALYLRTVDGMCFCNRHPFILLGVRSWALFLVRQKTKPTATMDISGSRVQNALAACKTLD